MEREFIDIIVGCDAGGPRSPLIPRREHFKRVLVSALSQYLLENFDELPLEMAEVFGDGPSGDYFTLQLALLVDPPRGEAPVVYRGVDFKTSGG